MANADSKWMRAALRQARVAGDKNEVPVGAVLVRDGKIVSRGHNLRESRRDPLAHAEIRAIASGARKLKTWRLSDCDLYVTLEPCPMCLAACQQARVARVVYGARDPKGGALCLGYALHSDKRTHHRFEVEQHSASAPECGEILSAFFRAQRAKKKRSRD